MKKLDKFYKTKYFLAYIFIVLILSTLLTYVIDPNLKEVMNSVSKQLPKEVTSSEGIDLVFAYVKNNGFAVPLQMFIFSLLPIPYLYMIQPTITAILPGILFGIALRYDTLDALNLIISSIPHFCIELLGMCIFATLLYYLNISFYGRLYSKILKRHQKQRHQKQIKIKDAIADTIKYYFILVLPIIIVAGFVETYVPDLINNLLTKYL